VIGILVLSAPAAATMIAVQLLGLYWLIDGLFTVVSLVIDRTHWLLKLIGGVIGILAGISIVQHPVWATLLVPSFYVAMMGVMGIIIGLTELVQGFRGGGWGMAILGGLNVLLGLVLVFNPFVGALSLTLLLGAMAVVGGVAAVFTAFKAGQSPAIGGAKPI
jgi:uncharacterized membrane protein HdeD (DUF308 family)